MAYIVVYIGGKEVRRADLMGRVTLGRSAGCTLCIDEPSLSREHCRFEQEGKSWYVIDLQSRNGMFVLGKKVDRSLMGDKDIVRIGEARIEFRDGIRRPARAPDPGQDHLVRMMISELQSKAPATTDQPAKPLPRAIPRLPSKPNGNARSSENGAGTFEDPWNHGANSLAFQRPPPTPIVRPRTTRETDETRRGA